MQRITVLSDVLTPEGFDTATNVEGLLSSASTADVPPASTPTAESVAHEDEQQTQLAGEVYRCQDSNSFIETLEISVELLKCKLFSLLGLISANEAESLTDRIERLRDTARRFSDVTDPTALHLQALMRFTYEEVALRWYAKNEVGDPIRFRQAVASEIEKRLDYEQLVWKQQKKLLGLLSHVKVLETSSTKRATEYASQVEKYHQELRTHRIKLDEYQRKLDIRENFPRLLEGGEEDVRRADREDKQHLEFLLKNSTEEALLLRKSIDERSALIQTLEEELEAERSEAKALRREFRLYLEDQEKTDEEFRRTVLQNEAILAQERQAANDLKAELIRAKEAQKVSVDRVDPSNGAGEVSHTPDDDGHSHSHSVSADPEAGNREENMAQGHEIKEKKTTKKKVTTKGRPKKSPRTTTNFDSSAEAHSVPGISNDAVELAQLAEERKQQLDEAVRQKLALHRDLEDIRSRLFESQRENERWKGVCDKLRDDTAAKEAASLLERNRERAFLKKKVQDLQEKLARQEQAVEKKMQEFQANESELVKDITLMHSQFGLLEKHLSAKYGPEILRELAAVLSPDTELPPLLSPTSFGEASFSDSTHSGQSPSNGMEDLPMKRTPSLRDLVMKSRLATRVLNALQPSHTDGELTLQMPRKEHSPSVVSATSAVSRRDSTTTPLPPPAATTAVSETPESELFGCQMMVEDLLSQLRLHLRAHGRLKSEKLELEKRLEQEREAARVQATMMRPLQLLKRSEDTESRLGSRPSTAAASKISSPVSIEMKIPEPQKSPPPGTSSTNDFSLMQLFPGVESAVPYFDMFETFCALRRQLAQLVVICDKELVATATRASAEKTKILTGEKFIVLRAIESLANGFIQKLHKKKDDMMRRREEELERVLSSMQNISLTHPKEVTRLARIARQSSRELESKSIEKATQLHPVPVRREEPLSTAGVVVSTATITGEIIRSEIRPRTGTPQLRKTPKSVTPTF